ncbi:MAG: DUF6398 domain-containing protein [Cyanophyceae cyanobacterium]
MAKSQSESVPEAMQDKFDGIVTITDDFCQQYLNDEYAQLIRYATAALCRQRPSPLAKGRDRTWACGITHAVGMVNFLFDPSQDPHISAKNLYQEFGVSSSTGQTKSKLVRDILEMHQMDPEWCLPSKMDENPLAWLISLNGMVVDTRSASRELQEFAYNQGLIPYIPDTSEQAAASEPSQKPAVKASPDTLYVFDVYLLDGPLTEAFIANNPVVSRTIEMKGRSTLADLHKTIFQAFDRREEHLYEFQLKGQGPHDPNAKRYGVKRAAPSEAEALTGDVASTAIASLDLAVNEVFGYWFDFGDDWWHQINVVDIVEQTPPGKYPIISNRVGDSPPQYTDFD